MIQATADRLAGLAEGDQLYVITGQRYAGLTAEQLPQIPADNILVEPSGRNTAPAIGLAAIHLVQRDPDAIMAIFPADHVIAQTDAFQTAVRRGIEAAQNGYLVTLGIEATEPHTGYGYIKRAALLHRADDWQPPIFAVENFLEKPDQGRAEAFLEEGGYYWNGGIFISRADAMLDEIARLMPEMYAALTAIGAGLQSPDHEQVLEREWSQMPSISIDYGIMEGAQRVAVIPLDAGWNDVGSWDALDTLLSADAAGNFIVGNDVVSVASQGNIAYGSGRLIALVGVQDLVIVDTGDALLVGHRDQMQKVKDVVTTLKDHARDDLL
jgi:mannose-1-phosphate guanylyltransferase